MQPGDMITPEVVLAKRFSVSHKTLRQALDVLVDEGLVHRYRGRGTVVADRLGTGELAVVVRPALLGPTASPIYQLTSTALMEKVQARNNRWQVKYHLGRHTEHTAQFPATLDLLDEHVLPRLRGVFAFNPLYEVGQKLDDAKIPVVRIGRTSVARYRVSTDQRSFFDQAIGHLVRHGCRSAGLFWLWSDSYTEDDRFEHDDEIFARSASHAEMEPCGRWVHRIESDPEQGGYEAFLRFWRQENRPMGLVVADDIVCRGVLRAILQLGLRLPDDLHLVTFANRGVSLPYHQPIPRVEFNYARIADRAVDMMLTLLRGEQPSESTVLLPGELVTT